MNNQSPFYIYISNEPIQQGKGSGGGTRINASSLKKSDSSKESTKEGGIFISKYIVTRVTESAIHSIESAISNSIDAMGYLEGNYTEQLKYQQANAIAQRIANTALTAGVAVATGHPLVGAIDVAVGIVNTGVSLYFDNIKQEAMIRNQNYSSTQLSKRAGLSSTRDGSRGTEN